MNKTVMTGAIAFATLAVGLVLGTQVVGVDDQATPWITSLLGFFAVTITQILGNKDTTEAKEKVEELNKDLRNGTFERLLREAIQKVAADEATKLEIRNGNEPVKEESTDER
ncbi:hypothetical protein SEA_WHEEHEIM_21 [Streptomyces phage WheeHeim]|uniref:Uncharacterized protein n=1 Tax=Streptomyces phage WheeHeim TaxID=2500797 RepID=A0A411AXW3_9VIRU|nr:hypothetical protein KMD61_gp23 [Streptomyces phage WheeHeim]QAX92929.1 hypothetical protein SEA_WHEEHEIM_21 [Streptomyces phage WheeHeim]